MCVVTCLCGGPRNEDNCVPGMNVASVHTCLDAEFWLYVCRGCYRSPMNEKFSGCLTVVEALLGF